MAEQYIEEIYRISNIIYELERTVEEIRIFADNSAARRLDQIFPDLTELCKECIHEQLELGKHLWDNVKKITEIERDLTAIGDVIELNVLPDIRKYIAFMANIDVDVNSKYSVRSTVSGYLTIYDRANNILLHSRNDPMYEARMYVRSFYDSTKRNYYVFGCGMGYAVYQLYEQSEGFTNIVLYEPDDIVYETAVSYGVLSWVPSECIERYSFKNVDDFLREAEKNNVGILINISSAHVMEDGPEKRKLIKYWMWQNTIRQFEGNIGNNRARNNMLGLPDAEEYTEKNICEEAVVVAAGPSLSENMELLKNWVGKKKIIAVGNVFQKLLCEKVVPDCVVMIDPTDLTLRQLPETDEDRVPMLLDDNVFWKLPRMYKGPKYFMREWSYTGTVSSAAIEVAIRMKAKTVFLIGLDLGYPIMQSHADGIGGNRVMSETGLFKVECMDGGEVLTDKHLDYYREQIEIQIKGHSDIDFCNLSEHGAKIHGTRHYSI